MDKVEQIVVEADDGLLLRRRLPMTEGLLKVAILGVAAAETSPTLSEFLTHHRRLAADRRKPPMILEWDDIEWWQQQGSGHIQTGYREANGSYWECLRSWTYLHNDTINIYSHFIGCIIFVCLPTLMFASTIPPRWMIATPLDVAACSAFFFGTAICFLLSTCFHTLHCHSHPLYHTLISLDILGILLLMSSATLPLLHFAFLCHPDLKSSYMLATTVLSSLCAATIAFPRLRGPQFGLLRAVLFATFAVVSFIVPAVHAAMLTDGGWGVVKNRMAVEWVGGLAGCNGVGVLVYALKFPERWFPRTFDIFGSSHQLMHIFVLLAALSYTVGVFNMFDYSHSPEGACLVTASASFATGGFF